MGTVEPPGGSFLKEIVCLEVTYGNQDPPLTCKYILYYYNKKLIITDVEGKIIDRIELFLTPKQIVEINFKKIASKEDEVYSIGELKFDCGDTQNEILPETFVIFFDNNEIVASDLNKQTKGRILLNSITKPITNIDFFEKKYQKKSE